MHNKKIITQGLIVSILLLNAPIDSMANVIEDYKLSVVDKEKDNSLKESKFEEFFNDLFDRFKKPKEFVKINKNIKAGTVKEITLNDNDFVPNLDGNLEGYETIRVTTTGNKKLVQQDYDNLRTSGIPKIDLSNASSDVIPNGAFNQATHLTEFKFPQGVKTIDDSAFKDCSGLTGDLVIPNTVTRIGYRSFIYCSGLTGDLVIPDSVTSIGDSAFYNCSGFNGKLVISNSLTKISDTVFNGCSGLTGNLIIPDSVTSIGNSAFKYCSGLTGDLIIPDSVTVIENSAFWECNGFTGNLIIPNSITEIKDYTFWNCTGFNGNLIIPDSVTSIGTNAFYRCSGLTGDLIIPDSVTVIGNSAFYDCSGFTGNLIIPNSITEIKDYTFWNCSGLTGNLIIPNSVTSIGIGVFKGCSGLTGDLIIPNSVTVIGSDAFNNLDNVNKIVIKVNKNDEDTEYKVDIILNLPNTTQTVIDLPYDFNIRGTWLENTKRTIGKPSIKNIVYGEEIEFVSGGVGKKVSLYIPVPYEEDNITVLKDGKPYVLPIINEENKYIFTEDGLYEIKITTDLGNVSNITFEIEGADLEIVKEAISKAEESLNPADIEEARDLVNALPESSKKDEFQGRLDAISPNIEFETKNVTANLDVYIKSENLLSLSLNTNSVTFEDFSGVEDDEKLNAIMLTVNSSLPYDVKAYLPSEIIGSKYGEEMNKEIFNIRANGEMDYQTFEDTETPLILLSEQEAGNNNNHGIDLKLASDLAFKNDVYKATVKFEVEQK